MPQLTTKITEHFAPFSQKGGITLPFVGSKVLHHKSEMHAKTKRSKQTFSSRGELFELPSPLPVTPTPTPSPPTHPPKPSGAPGCRGHTLGASERCPKLAQKLRSTSAHPHRRLASCCLSLLHRSYTTTQKCMQKPSDPSRLAPRGGELDGLPSFLHQESGIMLPFVGSKLLHHKSEMHAKTKRSKQTFSSRGSSSSSLHPFPVTHTPTPSPPTHPPKPSGAPCFRGHHPKAPQRCPNLLQNLRSTSLHSPRRVASRCPSLLQRSYTTTQKCLQKTKGSKQKGTSSWGAPRAPFLPPPDEWHHAALRRFKTLTPHVRNACKN